ncbi:hypothetical protein E4U53_007310 [Claviceps sorghi]|nr:hypothetical protein E4U53_007310 [Claviceps sorghi]
MDRRDKGKRPARPFHMETGGPSQKDAPIQTSQVQRDSPAASAPAYSRVQYLRDAMTIHKAKMECQVSAFADPDSLRPGTSALAVAIIRGIPVDIRHSLEDQVTAQFRDGTAAVFSDSRYRILVLRFHQGPNEDDVEDFIDDSFNPPIPQSSYKRQVSPSPRQRRTDSPYRSHSSHEHSRRLPTLKPDLLAFDSTTENVSAYVSKLDWFAQSHGEENVLLNIVPGLMSKPSSDGCKWFNSLNSHTKVQLRNNLTLWKTLLHQRFRRDRGQMLMKADRLKHSFAKEDDLSLQDYIDQKIAMFIEAGNIDDDQIARRLVMGVDPSLAKLIDVSPALLDIDDIKHQLTSRHYAAKSDWSRTQKDLKLWVNNYRNDQRSSRSYTKDRGDKSDKDRKGSGDVSQRKGDGRDRRSDDRKSNDKDKDQQDRRNDRSGRDGNNRRRTYIDPEQYSRLYGKESPAQAVKAYVTRINDHQLLMDDTQGGDSSSDDEDDKKQDSPPTEVSDSSDSSSVKGKGER